MTPSFRAEPKHWTLIAALIIAVYACYLLIEPYIGAIVLAFIVSLLFFPVHKRIEEKIGQAAEYGLSALLYSDHFYYFYSTDRGGRCNH